MRLRAAPVAFASVLVLAGCGGGDRPPPVTFKPPSYDYLTKLRLNVGDVRIEDQTPPATGPSDLAAQAPTPPAQAMRRMAEDRLVASGNSGTAVFTIDQAAITGQPGGTLDGTLAAHLDIIGPSGGHTGYAEAHVSHQFVPGAGTDNDGLRSELYDLTNQMMGDMNVELEYQVRRTLGDWLLDASGAPVGASVEQQSLGPAGPGSAQSAAGTATNPVPAAAAMPAAAPASNSVGAPMQLAPSPGTSLPGVSMAPPADADASGPTMLAPPPQADTGPASGGVLPAQADPIQSAPTQPPPSQAAPVQAAPATINSPPPGFLRLPNGYLQPVPGATTQGAVQGTSPSQTGPVQLAPSGY